MTTNQEHHRRKLRRLRILQALAMVAPNPMAEQGLLHRLEIDTELEPTLDKVRADIGYLADNSLIKEIRYADVDWRAGILTQDGEQWLNHAGDMGLEIHSPDYLPPARKDHRGRESTLYAVSPDVRAWLDQALADRRMTYTELASALKAKGYQISRAAVGRYGKARKEEIERRRQRAAEKAAMARALASVFTEDEDIPDMMRGVYATAMVATVDAIDNEEYDSGKDTLAGLVGALPKIGRGFREAEKHKIEQETRKAALTEAADRVEQAAQARGLGEDDAKFWREKVLMGM